MSLETDQVLQKCNLQPLAGKGLTHVCMQQLVLVDSTGGCLHVWLICLVLQAISLFHLVLTATCIAAFSIS